MLQMTLRTLGGTAVEPGCRRAWRAGYNRARQPRGEAADAAGRMRTQRKETMDDTMKQTPLPACAFRRLMMVAGHRDRGRDRDAGRRRRANRRHRQWRPGHAIRYRAAHQAHSAQQPQDADTQRGDRGADQRETEDPAAEALHHRRHRQGRRQRLRQHGAANAGDAERLHRQSGETGREARNAQVAHQGRSDLEPDHPRPLPEQLPVQRPGHRRPGSQAKNRDDANRGRLRLHASPDPVRGAARIAAGGLRGAREGSRGAARADFRAARRASRWRAAFATWRCAQQVVKSSAELPAALREVLDEDRAWPADRARRPRSRASRSTRCAASVSPTTRPRKKKFATRCTARRSNASPRSSSRNCATKP